VLFGDGELDSQRIDADDGGDAGAARDVVADADEPFGDESRQWCAHGGVSHGFPRQRHACACAFERPVRLVGQVLLRLILLARCLELGAPLIELALRDHLLIDQRPHAVEFRIGEIERRLGVHDVGNARLVEGLPRDQAELGFDLRGVGFGFLQLR
jgi:hypothetical protein